MNKELNTVQYGKITLESLLKKINKDRDDKDKTKLPQPTQWTTMRD
jgi:hypothetical protein